MTNTNPNKLKSDKKGKVKDENALQRRQARRKNRGGTEVADWASADSSLLQQLISTVTQQHGTITLGYTKDGGAYYLSYYFGDESEAAYCRPTEGIDLFLEGEIESFNF